MFGIGDSFWNYSFIISVQVNVCSVDTFVATNAVFRDQGWIWAPPRCIRCKGWNCCSKRGVLRLVETQIETVNLFLMFNVIRYIRIPLMNTRLKLSCDCRRTFNV